MPRNARVAPGGWVFHVLNRRNGFGNLFEGPACYRAFLHIIGHCAMQDDMRILAYCAMPTHWHMLLWPREDGDLARFVHRVSVRHTTHWHRRNHTTGRGHLYQARYKSFAVHTDEHLLTVCRYVERNPLRSGLVDRAESWPWSSAAARQANGQTYDGGVLTPLPVGMPEDWNRWVNQAQTTTEVDAVRRCLQRGLPYGGAQWQDHAAGKLGIRLPAGRRGRRPARRSHDAPAP